MHTNTGSQEAPQSGAPQSGAPHPAAVAAEQAAAEADLHALLERVAAAERHLAEAVELAGRVAGSGAAERCYGLTPDLVLGVRGGLAGADRYTLLTTGEVLATMPMLAAAHRRGRVTYGFVRTVAMELRRRSLDERAAVDAAIAAALDEGADDVDGLLAATAGLLAELAGKAAADRRDANAQHRNALYAQASFDGRVNGRFDLDAPSGATMLGALAAAQARPCADDPDRDPHQDCPQARSNADALVAVCRDYLIGDDPDAHDRDDPGGGGGPDGGGGPGGGPGGCDGGAAATPRPTRRPRRGRGRPTYVVDLDLERLAGALPARLRTRLFGPAPGVAGRRVACDAAAGADVRVVVTRGGMPWAVAGPVGTEQANLDLAAGAELAALLGVSRRQRAKLAPLLAAVLHAILHTSTAEPASTLQRVMDGQRVLCHPDRLAADDIPTQIRQAVLARDRGCRFVGCTAPVDFCDVHHLRERDHGGDHHPDNLVALCRKHHTLVHKHGWTLTLDPHTGVLTGRRGDLRWRTRPRARPLPPPDPQARPNPQPGPDPPAKPHPPDSGPDPPDGLPF